MAVICPTVTATDPHIYRTQIERLQPFVQRIHVDLADGIFAPKLLNPDQVWWPDNLVVDMHLMYKDPLSIIDLVLKLKPHMVIIHAEADGSFKQLVETLKPANIKVGVALLAKTPVEVILSEIESIDHILIFSGDLGHFGGTVDMGLLSKAQKIKNLTKPIEIGWDGGINDTNVNELAKGGIDVMNVGGFIQRSDNPVNAYAKLNLALMDGHS
jgi:ribulose-phosphate 3-epimerase